MRVPDLLSVLRARRNRVAGRFHGGVDGLRLVVLGVLLMCLASLGLAGPLFKMQIPDYGPGNSAIFGGLMLCIAIIRIGQPALYLDWIASGLLYIGLGLTLLWLSIAASTLLVPLLCILFLASALLRLWIAMTIDSPGDGTAWLAAGALIGLFSAAWILVMELAEGGIDRDVVLSVDLMLYGLSIAGLGQSLQGQRK
ncbi:hypothetical protein V5F34_11510 [Xanthobacter autotrophicus]|uniref:hypothetical protein n=1 Tax=Xanthobacter autotrophicus TaxID=280 RepID=UPI00372B526F